MNEPATTTRLKCGLDLRVFQDDHWQVWIGPEGGVMAGTCIGAGATKDEALKDALTSANEITGRLAYEELLEPDRPTANSD